MERKELNLTPEANDNLDLESLRTEIAFLREEELGKKARGENYLCDLEDTNPSELTEEDLEIYREFKNKDLTREELNGQGDKTGNSGKALFAWLSNQLMNPENMRWFDPKTYKALFDKEKKE